MKLSDRLEDYKFNEYTTEQIFFRYAYPCVGMCQMKRNASAEDIAELHQHFAEGTDPSKELLTKVFPNAMSHIKEWSAQGVRQYFLYEHNILIQEEIEQKKRPKGNGYSCMGLFSIATSKNDNNNNKKIAWVEYKQPIAKTSHVINLFKEDVISGRIYTTHNDTLIEPAYRRVS